MLLAQTNAFGHQVQRLESAKDKAKTAGIGVIDVNAGEFSLVVGQL